jgi:hypothetical protein
MPEDKVIVPPGSKVTIEISEETGTADIAKVESPEVSGIMEGAQSVDTLFRRINPIEIITLNLGTRLLSSLAEHPITYMRPDSDTSKPVRHDDWINEYIEIESWTNLDYILPEGAAEIDRTIPPADLFRIDGELLGQRYSGGTDTLDPLDTTPANGSGRILSNVMGAAIGLQAYNDAGTTDLTGKYREKTAPAGEHWNTRNLADLTAQHEQTIKSAKKSWKHLIINGGGAFISFDTGDGERVKVTQAPDFATEETPFNIAYPLTIYLAPRPQIFNRENVGFAHGFGGYFKDNGEIGRIPAHLSDGTAYEKIVVEHIDGGAEYQISILDEGRYFATQSPTFPIPQNAEEMQGVFDRNIARGASKRGVRVKVIFAVSFKRSHVSIFSPYDPPEFHNSIVENIREDTIEQEEIAELSDPATLNAMAHDAATAWLTGRANMDIVNPLYSGAPGDLTIAPYAKPLPLGKLLGIIKTGAIIYYFWKRLEG